MRSKQVKDWAKKLSEGLLMTATDLLLFQIYLFGSTSGYGKTSRSGYAMIETANKGMETVNYFTIKEALSNLKRKGLIKSLLEPLITEAGKKRLAESIPEYRQQRTWDKVIYLIAYDIPEKKRQVRDSLRSLIAKLGAASLQASVWLTPYNPQKILQEFSEKPNFAGEIIVSCVGKDGYIGSEDIGSLISRLYRLDEINRQYWEYIEKFKKFSRRKKYKWYAAVSYLNILKQDPQLPFELLPDDWAGDEAYKIYSHFTLINK